MTALATITLPVSYTSVANVYETLPQLETDATTVTSAEIALQAGQAQAYVNARLAKFYTLPFSATPPVLVEITTDLAIGRIIAKRPLLATKFGEVWTERMAEARAMLDAIVAGSIPLVDSSGSIIAASTDQTEVWSNTKDYLPTFWEADDPVDMIIDRDKQTDRAAERFY